LRFAKAFGFVKTSIRLVGWTGHEPEDRTLSRHDFWRIRYLCQRIQLEPYHDLRYKPTPDQPALTIDPPKAEWYRACRAAQALPLRQAPARRVRRVSLCFLLGKSIRVAEKFNLLRHRSSASMI